MNILLGLLFTFIVGLRQPYDCLVQSGWYTAAALQYAATIPVVHVPQGSRPEGGDRYQYTGQIIWVDNPVQDNYFFCIVARHEYGHAFDDLYGWRSMSLELATATKNYGLNIGWTTLYSWPINSEKYADMNTDYPCNLLPYIRYFPQFDFRKACRLR